MPGRERSTPVNGAGTHDRLGRSLKRLNPLTLQKEVGGTAGFEPGIEVLQIRPGSLSCWLALSLVPGAGRSFVVFGCYWAPDLDPRFVGWFSLHLRRNGSRPMRSVQM
jgi:hypothetical protein